MVTDVSLPEAELYPHCYFPIAMVLTFLLEPSEYTVIWSNPTPLASVQKPEPASPPPKQQKLFSVKAIGK